MSKSGSSIQYGWSKPNGTSARRRRNGGTRCNRAAMTSCSRSRVSGSGAVDGSSTQTLPTWP